MLKCLEFLHCIYDLPKKEDDNIVLPKIDDINIPPDLYLDDLLEQINSDEETNKPQEIVLKEAAFDTSKIKSYCSEKETESNKEFRPQTFDEFIGQEYHKKRILEINLPKIRNGRRNHFFFDALPSAGKTTMARLIAKELGAKMIERVGQQLTPEEIINILQYEINESKEEHVVFFVDEIETMKKEYLKFLNPILEDFEISGKKIKPFVFIGATINKHILMAKSGDTFSRYFTHIRFSRYTIVEMIEITKQYLKHTFPDKLLPEEVINKIAENCKRTPRIANDMIEDYMVLGDIKKLIQYRGIIKDGLDEIDIKILRTLQKNGKPMGAENVAQSVGINEKDYKNVYEPYLVELGYIKRTPRRQIDVDGIKLLEGLK